jgi:outer membrane protein assembly factor BamD (BamD/ComL family)
MKRKLLLITFAAVSLSILGISANGQRNVTPAIDRDPLLETDAKHNLDVAWQAFGPARKAYKQVLSRFEETLAAYPTFSKIDEFLYLAGMSSYYLSENKGKQKVDLRSEKERERYAPEKLRDEAKMYLTLIVEKFPDSKYRSEAEKTLAILNKNEQK